MLDSDLKMQLHQYLQLLRQPIRLVASLDDGAASSEMLALVRTIADLSDQVTLDLNGHDARKPSFLITRDGCDHGVRFAGAPLGHEFTSLVLALLQAVALKHTVCSYELLRTFDGKPGFSMAQGQ